MNVFNLLKPTLIKKIKKNVETKTKTPAQSVFIIIDFRTNATQYDIHTTEGGKVSGASVEANTTKVFQGLAEKKIKDLKELLFLEVDINLLTEEIKAEVFYINTKEIKTMQTFNL